MIIKNLGDVFWEVIDVLALIEMDVEQGVSEYFRSTNVSSRHCLVPPRY